MRSLLQLSETIHLRQIWVGHFFSRFFLSHSSFLSFSLPLSAGRPDMNEILLTGTGALSLNSINNKIYYRGLNGRLVIWPKANW